MESNYAKRGYPKVIPLMPLEEKLKCRNVEADLRYHQPSSNEKRKVCSRYHILLLSILTQTYFEKLQEPGVLDVIKRNRAMMKPFSDVVDEVLINQ